MSAQRKSDSSSSQASHDQIGANSRQFLEAAIGESLGPGAYERLSVELQASLLAWTSASQRLVSAIAASALSANPASSTPELSLQTAKPAKKKSTNAKPKSKSPNLKLESGSEAGSIVTSIEAESQFEDLTLSGREQVESQSPAPAIEMPSENLDAILSAIPEDPSFSQASSTNEPDGMTGENAVPLEMENPVNTEPEIESHAPGVNFMNSLESSPIPEAVVTDNHAEATPIMAMDAQFSSPEAPILTTQNSESNAIEASVSVEPSGVAMEIPASAGNASASSTIEFNQANLDPVVESIVSDTPMPEATFQTASPLVDLPEASTNDASDFELHAILGNLSPNAKNGASEPNQSELTEATNSISNPTANADPVAPVQISETQPTASATESETQVEVATEFEANPTSASLTTEPEAPMSFEAIQAELAAQTAAPATVDPAPSVAVEASAPQVEAVADAEAPMSFEAIQAELAAQTASTEAIAEAEPLNQLQAEPEVQAEAEQPVAEPSLDDLVSQMEAEQKAANEPQPTVNAEELLTQMAAMAENEEDPSQPWDPANDPTAVLNPSDSAELNRLDALFEQDQSATEASGEPNAALVEAISKETAFRAGVMPLREEGGKIVCLVAEPVNPGVIEMIALQLGKELILETAPRSVVLKKLESAFGGLPPHAAREELLDGLEEATTKSQGLLGKLKGKFKKSA